MRSRTVHAPGRSLFGVKILVVEDEPLMGKSLNRGLTEAGHQCVWIKDGSRGLEEALSQGFDAIVLDLLLPGMPGLSLLKKLRARGVRTPVIVLTALGAVEDR